MKTTKYLLLTLTLIGVLAGIIFLVTWYIQRPEYSYGKLKQAVISKNCTDVLKYLDAEQLVNTEKKKLNSTEKVQLQEEFCKGVRSGEFVDIAKEDSNIEVFSAEKSAIIREVEGKIKTEFTAEKRGWKWVIISIGDPVPIE